MGEILKLNPNSDRYRICPECKIHFMANHRGMDFHSRKCANDYNNRMKKIARQLNVLNSNEIENEVLIESSKLMKPELPINKNVSIIKQILGENEHLQIGILDLEKSGIDIYNYDEVEHIKNTDGRKTIYGQYSLMWITTDKVLITTRK